MRSHPALAVNDVPAPVIAYTPVPAKDAERVIGEEHALWRPDAVMLSFHKTGEKAGVVRHVGFERDAAPAFGTSTGRSGLVRGTFYKHVKHIKHIGTHQAGEIRAARGDVGYDPQ